MTFALWLIKSIRVKLIYRDLTRLASEVKALRFTPDIISELTARKMRGAYGSTPERDRKQAQSTSLDKTCL